MRYTIITRSAVTFLLLASVLATLPAEAYIGAVGSPVKASNPLPSPPKSHNAASPASDNTEEPQTPLLVIRFNQQHVYFDRVLRQAVESAEKAKADALYDVVSIVPTGGNNAQQNERLSANAAGNLGSVVQELQNLGVQPSRIHSTTQSSASATAQEIQIFVD